MIDIDGSLHSGSGTIVRQAAAYAALTGQPVRVRNARAQRQRPGLRPQHLRAIQAVHDLVGGSLDGAEVDPGPSSSGRETPNPLAGMRGDIGTAGSATMLALSVLPSPPSTALPAYVAARALIRRRWVRCERFTCPGPGRVAPSFPPCC